MSKFTHDTFHPEWQCIHVFDSKGVEFALHLKIKVVQVMRSRAQYDTRAVKAYNMRHVKTRQKSNFGEIETFGTENHLH